MYTSPEHSMAKKSQHGGPATTPTGRTSTVTRIDKESVANRTAILNLAMATQ